MKIYVIQGVLDDLVILGMTRSKVVADFQKEQINKTGIGYHNSKVWIEEYDLKEDNYIEFE